ncbi:glycosyltransferase [Sulfitobacter albidus]|uniref:Glycosyltransferase n=1 Tax=Sulfitobacter albidus TaxID=2829501 RepID=A0A975JFQ4_9RHOB|nr:glycosyltransferase [Sulfitobacter albidus]QUJ77692.1 glycosyltransferase [Sulfitobacter albidus]
MTRGIPFARRLTFVVGMHRSGTSALARTLNLTGLRTPGNLIPQNEFNETGYWESRDVVSFNDLLLNGQDRHWSDPKPLELAWAKTPSLAADRAEALRVMQIALPGLRAGVVKDPRLSRTLPLWREALEGTGAAPVCLIACRHPLEVAQSLARRNGMDRDHALLLWETYTLEAEHASRGLPRAFVFYDDLLPDWRGTLGPALAQCGETLAVDHWLGAHNIDAYLSPRHRTHVSDLQDTPLPAAVKELWSLLQEGDPDTSIAGFDTLRAGWRRAWQQRAADAGPSAFPPKIAAWHLERSDHLASLGHLTAARDAARRATVLDPQKSGYWFALAKRLIALQRFREALKSLRRAIHLTPEVCAYHRTLAETLLKLGRPNKARAAVQAALALDPDQAELHFINGNILAAKAMPAAAIHCFERAIELQSGVAAYHFALSKALRAKGAVRRAETHARAALQLAPAQPVYLMVCATQARDAGDLATAERLFARAVPCHADPALPAHAQADVLHRMGRTDEAITLLRDTIRQEPGHGHLHDLLGRVLAKEGQVQAAGPAFDAARALDLLALEPPPAQETPGDVARAALAQLCQTAPPGPLIEQRCHRLLAGAAAQVWARDLVTALERPPETSQDRQQCWPLGTQQLADTPPRVAPRARAQTRCTLSIMIPVYNVKNAGWLRGCIDSILQQDPGGDLAEIVVVDDASPDGGAQEIVQDYAPRVQFHRNPQNLGLIGNHNQCLDIARGDFVHFVHQDDRILPGFYDALLGPLQQDETRVAAFSGWQFIGETGAVSGQWPAETRAAGVRADLLEALALYSWMTFPSIIVRRSAYEAVGGFSPGFPFVFDVDMWARLAALGPVWSAPAPLAQYRSHAGSATYGFSELERLTDRMRVRARTIARLAPARREAVARATFDMFFQVSWRSLVNPASALTQGDVVDTVDLLGRGWTTPTQRRAMTDLLIRHRGKT